MLDSTYRDSRFMAAAKRCLAAHIQRVETYRCSKEVFGSTHTERADSTYRENRLIDAAKRCLAAHIQTGETYLSLIHI